MIHDHALSSMDDFKRVVVHCVTEGLPLNVDSDADVHLIIGTAIKLRGSSLMEHLSSTDYRLLNIGNRPIFMSSTKK